MNDALVIGAGALCRRAERLTAAARARTAARQLWRGVGLAAAATALVSLAMLVLLPAMLIRLALPR